MARFFAHPVHATVDVRPWPYITLSDHVCPQHDAREAARRAGPSATANTRSFSEDGAADGWLGSRVVSVLDSGAEGPGFKSRPRRCRVTGKLFTPIVPLFIKQRNRQLPS